MKRKKSNGDYYRCEIASGAFACTVSLPGLVDTGKAKASFEDDVLKLAIPKTSDVRVAARPVPVEQTASFGILEVDADGLIRSFEEKPVHGKPIPSDPGHAFASM